MSSESEKDLADAARPAKKPASGKGITSAKKFIFFREKAPAKTAVRRFKKYERRFEALHPSEYHEVKYKVRDDTEWKAKLETRKNSAFESDYFGEARTELQKSFFKDISENNAEQWKKTIGEAYGLEQPLNELLMLDDRDFWFTVNPLSPAQPNYSEEVRDAIWALITAKQGDDANLILRLHRAILTYQPPEIIVGCIHELQENNISINELFLEPYLWTCLQTACRLNRLDAVKLLLENGANPNVHHQSHSPLTLACGNSNDEMVELLLKHGANVNFSRAPNGMTENKPLLMACQVGNFRIVELLLQNGADVQSNPLDADENEDEDEDGNAIHQTPLHVACEYGQREIAWFLLQNRANLNACADDDDQILCTPLEIACIYGHVELVKTLVAQKQFPLLAEHLDATLCRAAERGDTELVEFLLDNGANPTAFLEKFNYDISLTFACRSGNLDTVKLLMARGAKITGNDSTLYVACGSGNADLVRFLLARRTSPDDGTHTNSQLLLHACEEGHLDVIKCLLDYGAKLDLNSKDTHKMFFDLCRPQNAKDEKKTTVIAYLVDELKLPVNRVLYGETALLAARPSGKPLMRKLELFLLEKSIEQMPLADNAEWALYWEVLRKVYKTRIIPVCTGNPDLLLLCAIRMGEHTDEINRIIGLGANPHTKRYKYSPLQIAHHFNYEVCNALINAKFVSVLPTPVEAERAGYDSGNPGIRARSS
jgi:ankyrin repeat protein